MGSSNDGMQICYLLVLLVSIGFLVWGFIELLKQPSKKEMAGTNQKDDKITLATVSRQIRGFALIMLAHIIFVLGVGICTGLGGGLKSAQKILS